MANPSNAPLNFGSFASLFPTTDTTGPAALFKLGSALFDPIELHLGNGRIPSVTGATLITPDVRSRVYLLKRRQALSEWLEHVVKPTVEGDIRVKAAGTLPGTYTPADTVFTQLTGHQIEEACTVAMDTGYLKLATLVCQAGGDATFKADLRAQLKIWADEKLSPSSNQVSGSNGLISRGVWKVYRLLTGPDDQSDDAEMANWVDEVCTGLDWKRVFGLCLWYGMGVDAAVADVVRLYEGLVKRYTATMVARPIAQWQIEKQTGRPVQQQSGFSAAQRAAATLFSSPSKATEKQPEDPLFSLIRLHADPVLSLSQVLESLSFGPDERWGGVGMCWHLYIILSRAMRIRDFADRAPTYAAGAARRVNGRSQEDSDDDLDTVANTVGLGRSHTADLLTSAYAFQLEGWGMIQEAAFVLLHLEETEGYVYCIVLALWDCF